MTTLIQYGVCFACDYYDRANEENYQRASKIIVAGKSLWEAIYAAAKEALPDLSRLELCDFLSHSEGYWSVAAFFVREDDQYLRHVSKEAIDFACPWRRLKKFDEDAAIARQCVDELKRLDGDILTNVRTGWILFDAAYESLAEAEAEIEKVRKEWVEFRNGTDPEDAERDPPQPPPNARQIELEQPGVDS